MHGGGGTAAATLQDLGYEQMKGTTGSGEPPELKRRTGNNYDVIVSDFGEDYDV